MASEGPNSPSTGADAGGLGTAWSNPGNVTAADASEASATLAGLGTTNYLLATGFGFAIPGGATINGVAVEVKRRSGLGTSISDAGVSLAKAGSITGTPQIVGGFWPTVAAYQSYGGASDLWGAAWSAADVNGSGFGAGVGCSAGASGDTAYVDHVRITVYYTAAGAGPASATRTWRRPDLPTDPIFTE